MGCALSHSHPVGVCAKERIPPVGSRSFSCFPTERAVVNGDERHIKALRTCSTKLHRSKNRSIFLFLCGGADDKPDYVARSIVEQYLKVNPCGDNVICVRPENVLSKHRNAFESLDLLVLEKLIAEISDAILLFDESAGSLCELGAFAACEPISEVLTAFVPNRYKGVECFVVDGPVRHLESMESELSGVIYGDVSCPVASVELVEYLMGLREKTKAGKAVNNDPTSVNVGSFCLEILDLIRVFSPLGLDELEWVYRNFKNFDGDFVFDSKKLGGATELVTTEMLVCFLAAVELIDYKDGIVSMHRPTAGYFMLNQSQWHKRRIMSIRARYLVSRRKGKRRCNNVRP